MARREPGGVKRRFFLLPLLLVSAFAHASPASDYLGEVERYLRAYDGPVPIDLTALTRAADADLAKRCAENAACPLPSGRDAALTLVANFRDKHTNLKEPALARRVRAEMRGGSAPRVGVRLIPQADGGAVIGYVRPGSSAAGAGLKVGDFVSALNGQSPTAATLAEGEDAGAVTLTLTDGDLAGRDLTLRPADLPARDEPTLRRVTGPGGAVNVVNIPSFLGSGVAGQFFDLLRKSNPADALIVDVRANGGGSLNECLLAASAFGEVHHVLSGPGYTARYYAVKGRLLANTRPIASLPQVAAPPANRVTVLVGPHTASCGEVFAGALQQLGARVVGQPTAGVRNSAVGLYDLSDGSLLSVTTARAAAGKGPLLDASVVPNVAVEPSEADLRAGRDPALEAALNLLAAAQK